MPINPKVLEDIQELLIETNKILESLKNLSRAGVDRKTVISKATKYRNRAEQIILQEPTLRNKIKENQLEDSNTLINQKAQEFQSPDGPGIAILRRHLLSAIETNHEFDIAGYKERLLLVLNYEGLINILNPTTTAIVTVRMKEIAGNATDYADAVSSTRSQRGNGRTGPEMASFMWKTKYYGTAREDGQAYQQFLSDKTIMRGRGKKRTEVARKDKSAKYIKDYWETMAMRLQNCSTPAPYWELINYGNSARWANDRGGTPYPITPPTRFKENAELEIRNSFISERKQILDTVKEQYKIFNTTLNNLFKQCDRIIEFCERLLMGKDDVEVVRDILRSRGYPTDAVSDAKIKEFINLVDSGTQFGDARGRVYLGNARVRTIEIVRAIRFR